MQVASSGVDSPSGAYCACIRSAGPSGPFSREDHCKRDSAIDQAPPSCGFHYRQTFAEIKNFCIKMRALKRLNFSDADF
jgi:hypothetical protein